MQKEEVAYKDATRERWYILSVQNNYRIYWDTFIIFLAIYNAIALPMQIAYQEIQTAYDDNMYLQITENAVDTMFALDMIVLFFSAYIEISSGETVRQPKKIAINYLKGGFITDFISILPIILRPIIDNSYDKTSSEHEFATQIIKLFRLLKLLRVRKVNTVITNLQ